MKSTTMTRLVSLGLASLSLLSLAQTSEIRCNCNNPSDGEYQSGPGICERAGGVPKYGNFPDMAAKNSSACIFDIGTLGEQAAAAGRATFTDAACVKEYGPGFSASCVQHVD
ncbi:hypothetical protein F5Y15DRAFT_211322 [Xylariaceae sp. FL0016]|nr:hypothetical protein F5Y15DRAFT_211322 [Xylariaceae sp. FL0016]